MEDRSKKSPTQYHPDSDEIRDISSLPTRGNDISLLQPGRGTTVPLRLALIATSWSRAKFTHHKVTALALGYLGRDFHSWKKCKPSVKYTYVS